jgi:hypothetical protein
MSGTNEAVWIIAGVKPVNVESVVIAFAVPVPLNKNAYTPVIGCVVGGFLNPLTAIVTDVGAVFEVTVILTVTTPVLSTTLQELIVTPEVCYNIK